MKQLLGFARPGMFAIVLAFSNPALAALGQGPSTLTAATPPTSANSARLSASTSTRQASLVTVHETQLETGTVVREFANAQGVVFGLTWTGPVLPDLTLLLGSYYNTFHTETQRARQQGKRGSPVIVEHAELVVRSHGRMRNFSGHAFAPALVPAGMDIHDVIQ